jgi:hypothetical protein
MKFWGDPLERLSESVALAAGSYTRLFHSTRAHNRGTVNHFYSSLHHGQDPLQRLSERERTYGA